MSLGLSIFLSAILLLAVWQIDKHSAWRKSRRITLWLIGGIIVLGIAAYGLTVWWPSYNAKKEIEAQVAEVRDPANLPYWGIKIGMTKDEVRYLKGPPTQTRFAEWRGKNREIWDYLSGDEPSNITYNIYWNASATVAAVACHGGDVVGCERIAGGIGIGSKESEVRARLGVPMKDSPPDSDGTKTIQYGDGMDWVAFMLERGVVVVVSRAQAQGAGTAEVEEPSAASQAQ